MDNHQKLELAKQQHRSGQVAEAESVYRQIIISEPENAEAHHMMGIVEMSRGNFTDAETYLLKAIHYDNAQAGYYSNLGNLYGIKGHHQEAYEAFSKALTITPDHPGALGNVSTALIALGRQVEAIPFCQKLLTIRPDDLNARLNLSAAYVKSHEVGLAIDVLREGLQIYPNHHEFLYQLASAYEFSNNLDQALSIIENLQTLNANEGRYHLLQGILLRRKGLFDEAIKKFNRALVLGLTTEEQLEAYHQSGLALDAKDKSQAAFEAFEKSNQLMSQLAGPEKADGSRYLEMISYMKSIFNLKTELKGLTDISDYNTPIFFVGFPRSGTTLMEQIFKSHPALVTTEENSPLSAVIMEIEKNHGAYPQSVLHLDAEELIRLRQYFFDVCKTNNIDYKNKIVIDKLPLNIVHLGLAKFLFPNAKVIVALRDPRDVCLSCFMQKFEINVAMANFLSLDMTTNTYQAVMDLYLHYKSLYKEAILEYRYEDLIENFDTTLNALLQFVDVDWHEDLALYREKAKQRVINTPSYRDVTSPLNTKAIARWKKYESEFEPFMDRLSPFVDIFGYR